MKLIISQKKALNKNEIKKYEQIIRDYDVIMMPPIPYLGIFNQGIYHLGSQKIDLKEEIGSINIESLKGVDCEYILIDAQSNNNIKYIQDNIEKIKLVYKNKMIPIILIGESNEEKELNKSIKIIEKQLSNIYNDKEIKQINPIIVYNPIYNIERNIKKIAENIFQIKIILHDYYAIKPKIFLGSNINFENIKEIMSVIPLDGFYITEKSNDIHEIIKMYNEIE